MKKGIAWLLLLLALFGFCACKRSPESSGSEVASDQITSSMAEISESQGSEEDENTVSTEDETIPGVFDFETKTVLLNSGYEMPIMGLGT